MGEIENLHNLDYFEHLRLEGPELIELCYYDAKIIFEYIIADFNKKQISKFHLYFEGTLFSLSFALSPALIRVYNSQNFHGTSI